MQKYCVLWCIVWCICACGQASVAAPTTTASTPVATIPVATATSVAPPIATITPPEALSEADPVVKQAVQDLGYGVVDAEYMARTGVTTQQLDATTWRILMTTPTGHLIDQTISYTRGAAADIGKPVQVAPVSPDAPDAFAYSYTMSAKDAPPEMLDAMNSAAISRGASRMMMINPPLRMAVDVDAILVTIKGFIKQYGKDKFGDFTKEYDKLAPEQKFTLNDRWNTLKASMYVLDAVWMFEKIWPHLNSIDYLQACAENPWNPLTKKSYQDFPDDKQRIINRLESARSEIKYEGMYMYTIVMNKVLLMGVPGLQTVTKFILGSTLDNFVKETEQRLKNLVAEMEKMVTPCNGWRYVQHAPAGYPYTFEGTKCGGIDGYWTINDDSMIEGAHVVSKIEITVTEEQWLKGKKDFLWTLEQTSAIEEVHSTMMQQGFTKNIVLLGQSIQFDFDNPLTCRMSISPNYARIDGCAEIMKYGKFTGLSGSTWVEDPAICQAEKADMMRYSNWKP